MKRSLTVPIVIVLMLISAGVGWWIGYQKSESDLATLALIDNAGSAGLSTAVLQLLAEGREDTARKILNMSAESFLREANVNLSDAGSLNDLSTPNVLESMRRAKSYFESTGQVRPAAYATNIIAALEPE